MVDPDLEAGFSMEKLIFGFYKYALWKDINVQTQIFNLSSWQKDDSFFNDNDFKNGFPTERKSHFSASGLEIDGVRTYVKE